VGEVINYLLVSGAVVDDDLCPYGLMSDVAIYLQDRDA
jgi:hypothetical protein